MLHTEVVHQIIDAIQRSDAQAYAEFFTEDGVLEHPLSPNGLRGRAAIRESEQALFDSFSDVAIDVRSMTAEGSRVVAEVVLRATHTGPIDLGEGEPLAATGQRIEIEAVWIFEFGPEGLLTAERDYFDTAAFMSQLGIGS